MSIEKKELLKKIEELKLEIEKVNEICDSEIERYTKIINERRKEKLLELNEEINKNELLLENL